MDKISQIKQLISEINRLHREFFETGKVDKINLSRTITHVPAPHIYRYRLTLHESVNDYLMTAAIDIKYFYRVKTPTYRSRKCWGGNSQNQWRYRFENTNLLISVEVVHYLVH